MSSYDRFVVDARPGLASAHPRRPAAAPFRGLLARAAGDSHLAARLTMAFSQLGPEEQRALRQAILGDAEMMALDLERLLACWAMLDPTSPWRAWSEGESYFFAAPGRDTVEAQAASIHLHEDWSPGPQSCSVDVDEAVDRLAGLLWTARCAGQPVPNALGAFADLFDR